MFQDHAILTGDLVKSSAAGSDVIDHTMQILLQASMDIVVWKVGGATRFTRYRGDGWQMVVQQPEYALRAALFLRATLRADTKSIDTRIAIGQGQIDSFGTVDLSDAHGAAFTYSGQALDAMKGLARLTIAGDRVSGYQRIIVDLLAERSTRWTREQAEAMVYYLHPDNPTLNDIGPRLGISPQAVNYRLRGAAATEMRKALHEWEEAYFHTNLDEIRSARTHADKTWADKA